MKLRVMWNGRSLRDIYLHGTHFQVSKWRALRFAQKLLIVSLLVSGLYTSYSFGFYMGPPTIKQVSDQEAVYPVLERIAKCESGGSQYDKNGQVLLHWNKNGTIDIGKYAVNETYWGAQATKLGFDLTVEADNRKMAVWIYYNKGTGDWSASHACWK